MNEYTIEDLARENTTGKKQNYLGEYKPKDFWHEYGKVYYSTFSEDEKDKKKSWIMINLSELIARIAFISPETVLEVGCGFARCIPFTHLSVISIKKIVGVEFSYPMLEKSKEYLKDYERKDEFKLINGDARNLPFKDKSFDLTYTHVCLTHIPPEFIPQVVKEIDRVTKSWIVHIERFRFPYEHPAQHRWSHLLAPMYLELGWKMHDNNCINEEHHTNALVLKR